MKMKKALIILLAVLLACEAFPAGSFAEEQALFQYWIQEDGTAAITGINDLGVEILEIPAELDGIPVTTIESFAFGYCGRLVSVTIPEGVTSIGGLAFGNCYMLESVSIPDSLVTIEMSAFRSKRLTEIKVSPDHPVFAVENEALIDKNNMTLVRFLAPEITGTYEIAPGIRSIGPAAFELNGRFSSLVIPDSVTGIGEEAMSNCVALREIVIPDSVTSIGSAAFFCCASLESVTIPDSVTRIGNDVFDCCYGLTSINISPDHPVYEANDLLVVEKDSKTVIAASGAIRGKAAVPEGILAIGNQAFRGCHNLKELYIPESVREIGWYAFCNDTVIRACAGSATQAYCAADSTVRFSEITPEEFEEEVRKLEQEKADRKPAESVYSREEGSENPVSGMYTYQVLEDGTAQILKADPFLTDGNIPAELDGHPVTCIGINAFRECTRLQSVVIPEGVVSLGTFAFWSCAMLESVSIPDSLVAVDYLPFVYCRKLKTIEVSPDHPVFGVENRALVNKQDQALLLVLDHEDTGAYTVTQGIRRIEDWAFEGSRFSSILLPDSVTAVGGHAFGNCVNLTEFTFPEGVTSIGSQAFYGSRKLESVTIPDSMANIGGGVFGDNPALAGVRISPDHPAYEMNGSLLVDKRTQEIVMALNSTPAVFEIPEGIRAIGDRAFQGSCGLKELVVPEGVTKIGPDAFSGCADLRTVTLPASLNEVREHAFDYSRELLIMAPAGSWAEQYAREKGYRFVALSNGYSAEKPDLYEYEVKTDGTAEITGIKDKNIEIMKIPAELNGIPVTSIGSDAFYNCENLRSAVIPEGVVSVEGFAFMSCARLESVSIPDSLVSVKTPAFAYCPNLKTVEVSPDHPVFAVENRVLVNKQDQTLLLVLDHEDTGAYAVAQGIREIGDHAFSGSLFSSILLPDSVTSVGNHAFSGCGNLTEFTFPEGVTDMDSQVFYDCGKLESVTIPKSLTRIGTDAFGSAPALTAVRISPDNPAYEMIGTFLVDKRKKEIVSVLENTPEICEIPEGIRSVAPLVAQGNKTLTELIVPEGVTKISWGAYFSCSNLRTITLPASLVEIGDRAFEYGPEERLIKAPAGSRAEQYARENGYAFEALPESADGAVEEKQDLYEYKVKTDGTAEITGIKDKNIKNMEIPAELDGHPVTSIGKDAFYNCLNLRSVVIPEGVVSVGGYAFWCCAGLESVSIPDSLVSIEAPAFGRCLKLKTVEVSPDHPVYAVENRALVNRKWQTLLTVLDHENTGVYRVAQGIREIEDRAFDGSGFSSILLPDSLTSVGNQAFCNCANLTGIIFPEGVTDIGSMVFNNSRKLESVTFPDSLTYIEIAAFAETPALTDVLISPDHPAYEMNGLFLVGKRNREIVSVLNRTPAVCEIPEGIKSIGPLAFQSCYDLTELVVPEGVTRIGWSAFNECMALKVITLPASLQEIGTYAFQNGPEDLLIKAPAGSWAEQYARENGYAFEAFPAETDGAD